MGRNFANLICKFIMVHEGKAMARNFGLPMQRARYQRRSFRPFLLIAFIVVGVINAAAHLR